MGRFPRPQIAGATYHVTSRGCAHRAIFVDEEDRETFEATLGCVVTKHHWLCQSYCLMTTHYHLLLTTPSADLGAGMHKLNGQYARSFNHRHGGSGHVFQGPYRAEFIQTDSHLLEVSRYIAMNPVRAGLCNRPEDWRWSSYRSAIGEDALPSFLAVHPLLELFADDIEEAKLRLRRFVQDAPD